MALSPQAWGENWGIGQGLGPGVRWLAELGATLGVWGVTSLHIKARWRKVRSEQTKGQAQGPPQHRVPAMPGLATAPWDSCQGSCCSATDVPAEQRVAVTAQPPLHGWGCYPLTPGPSSVCRGPQSCGGCSGDWVHPGVGAARSVAPRWGAT